MQKHTPDFEFQLLELCRMPFHKILGTPMGILTLRALKAEKLEALLDDPVWDKSLLIQLSSVSFEMLMRYILDRDLDKPAFRRELKTLTNPKLSKNAMSLAEQFRRTIPPRRPRRGPPRRSPRRPHHFQAAGHRGSTGDSLRFNSRRSSRGD